MNSSTVAQMILEEMLERSWSLRDIALRMGGHTTAEIHLDQTALHMYLVVDDPGVLLGEETARKLSAAFDLSEEFFVNLERNSLAPSTPSEKKEKL